VKKLSKIRRAAIAIAVIVAIAIASILMSGLDRDRILATDPAAYTIRENFALDATYPMKAKYAKRVKDRYEDILLWGSWLDDDRHQGKLISPEFNSPGLLSVYVSGYPNQNGNQLFLERTDTGEQLPIQIQGPGERWLKVPILLPSNWHQKPIRLVAIDQATGAGGWLGVSSPVQMSSPSLLRTQLPFLSIVPIYCAHAFLLLIPGLLLYVCLTKYQSIHPHFSLISSIALSCLIGYGLFWVYFCNHRLGLLASITLLLGSLLSLCRLPKALRQRLTTTIRSKDFLFPLSLMVLVGLFYLAIAYLPGSESLSRPETLSGWQQNIVSADSIIPKDFAERLYANQDPRQMGGDWLSSDRPPLQAGLVLTQRPLMVYRKLSYQLFGTLLQCAWVAAMWALCRTAQLSGRAIAIVMAVSIFSGFSLYNSVYVWPKFLAGSLVTLAIALALQSVLAAKPLSTGEIALGVSAIALGMLAHGGVIFTLPPVLLLLLWPQIFPGWRRIAIGIALFLCLMAPWTGYQKLYDPPGDRLVKFHLAGVEAIDLRPPLQVIAEAYGKLSLPEIANHKWENAKKLVGHLSPPQSSEAWRTAEFFHLFRALNLLSLGGLILPIVLLNKHWRSETATRATALILGLAIVSIVLWIVLLFGPGATVNHHGSYATMMMMFVALGYALGRLPASLTYFLLGGQVTIFAGAWLLDIPARNVPPTAMLAPNFPMIVLVGLTFVGLIGILRQLARSHLPQPILPTKS